jgi:spoIIIJ-associated protein
MSSDLNARVTGFVNDLMAAMGLRLEIAVEETPDNVRIELSGEGAELLVRRKGEALEALQHIVNTAFRREMRDSRAFVIDSLDYRKSKDLELRQMAQFLMEKAKTTGAPQEMGPLNPYARRLVHLAVAEDPQVTSESIGDAFLKTVIISARKS